ncbi:MAG: hypothetical protein MUE68_00300 [Bacteroidetes bacterium]|jgi:hypothetical protein|nr:hypothetical protein [Bacteroidota bacterium]
MKIKHSILPLLLPALLSAQGNSTGASVLKLPQHALTASLTDLSVVEPGRLEAAGVNPASMFSSDPTTAIAFTHTSWVQEISGQRLGLSFPTAVGRFSAAVAITRIPGIEVRESPGPAIGTFDAQTAAFQAGWANEVIEGIVAGLSASYLYEKLYLNESTGFSVDAGVMAETPVQDLVLGLSAVNLGAMSAFRTEAVELPSTVRLGAGYKVTMGHFELRPALAFRTGLNHDESGLTVGGTIMFQQLAGLRASWRSGDTARNLSFGLTALYRGIGFEYALVPFSSGLGTAQVVTFGLSF